MQLQTIRRALLRVMMPMLSCATAFLWQNVSFAQVSSRTKVKLKLSNDIDLALKQNRTLQLARLAVTDSEHKKEIARSAYFPQIKNESSILHVPNSQESIFLLEHLAFLHLQGQSPERVFSLARVRLPLTRVEPVWHSP